MYHIILLDHLPLWLIFIGTTAFILLVEETGFRLGSRRLARGGDGESLYFGAVVASTLGLLAFMLAFTFGAGTDRLDAKRALVLQQANAISTAYLRTELLPEPYASESRGLLLQYLEQVLVIPERQRQPGGRSYGDRFLQSLEPAVAAIKQTQDELWAQGILASEQSPGPANNLYITSLNRLFDLLQTRITVGLEQRMPAIFWLVLYFLSGLGLGLVGYEAGVSSRLRNHSIWAVALAFASVMSLVVALDRPQTSVVAQQPLHDQLSAMRGDPGRDGT